MQQKPFCYHQFGDFHTPLYRPTKKHPRALFWATGGSEKVAVSESLVCATKAVRAGITAADRGLG